jgi:hypothetical protein
MEDTIKTGIKFTSPLAPSPLGREGESRVLKAPRYEVERGPGVR